MEIASYGPSKPKQVLVNPDGRFLYVVQNDKNIVGYTINTSGILTQLVPFTTENLFPSHAAIDPLGQYLYVTGSNTQNDPLYGIMVFTVDEDGALSEVDGSLLMTECFVKAITVDPTGQFVYVGQTLGEERILAFQLERLTGLLTSIGEHASGSTPEDLVTDPTGRFLYVATEAAPNGILGFEIGNDGTLIELAGSPFVGRALSITTLERSPFRSTCSSRN